jgi:hypothetical protein
MPLIEAFLIKQKIPYASSGGFLYDRQDVKTMFSVIRFLFDCSDGEYLDRNLVNADGEIGHHLQEETGGTGDNGSVAVTSFAYGCKMRQNATFSTGRMQPIRNPFLKLMLE